MKLVRWNPFLDVDRFFEEEFFTGEHQLSPAVDITQNEKEVKVKTSLPGVDVEGITINVQDNILTIEGETEHEEKKEKEEYYRQEIFKGSFARSITLPVEVKGEEAKASMKNGVLSITIPKADKVLPKKIEVKLEK